MGFDLTPSQKKARDGKGSLLVAAAAGSGKTRVLTERVIKLITAENNPVPADKLLIVTFTNSAAFEMRSRIENALLEVINNCDPNKTDDLLKQYNRLDSADISTIDSFCINIVRENFEECGIDQNFKVSNGAEMSDVVDGILSQIIDAEFEKKEKSFVDLLQFLDCEKDDEILRNTIKDIYNKTTTVPFPEKYLFDLKKPFNQEFKQGHIWFDAGLVEAQKVLDDCFSFIDNMEDIASYSSKENINVSGEINALRDYFDNIYNCIKNKNWDSAFESVSLDFPQTLTIKKPDQPLILYKNFRDVVKKKDGIIKPLRNIFNSTTEQMNEFLNFVSDAIDKLIEMVKEYSDKIFEAFCENNTLAFYQTEQLAVKLLCDFDDSGNIVYSDIARHYIGKYDYVMVDEYQDVNDLQQLMFEILSDNQKNLFVVGDVKQSIYKFRGSNPKNFLNKKNEYLPFDTASEEDKRKVILSENFRSRKCVCDFVNYVFDKLMKKDTGGIVYDEEEILNPAAKFPESDDESTDVVVINDFNSDEDDYYTEAEAIAEYIRDIISSKKQISRGDETSPIKYGDICVLFPNQKNATTLVKTLKSYDIPVSFNSDEYCNSPEISLVLALLNVINNPLNNVDLLTVLMSPLFSFTPDDIVLLRESDKKGNLYRSVVVSAKNGNEKSEYFLKTINGFKKKSLVMPLSGFINYLIYETEIFSIISSLDNSNYRRKNIYYLVNLAKEYTGMGIGGFVDYVRSLPEQTFAFTDNDSNSVKIMTMHKSKGLQFPVCILSDISHQFNENDQKGKIILSDNYGFTLRPFCEDTHSYIDNIGIEVAKINNRAENIAERIRLLYVAMTRAQEKLAIFVRIPKKTNLSTLAERVITGELPTYFIKNVHSLGILVLYVALMHPDGKALRDLSGEDVSPVRSNSRMNLQIYDYKERDFKVLQSPEEDLCENPELSAMIKSNINYEYPNSALTRILAKTSVSALVHSDIDDEYSFTDRPAFMNAGGLSASEKGTAIHKIMQFIDFSEKTDVESEIERLIEWKYITEKEGRIADIEKINAFFQSNLYLRILKSAGVFREMKFLTEINAGEVYDVPDNLSDKKIIVQGAVDLLFVENGQIVIVDFKTDRLDDPAKFAELYAEQLNLYSVACSKKFNLPVKENIIYSFNLSKEINLKS